MLTKIVVEKDGKKTKYEITDESLAREEVSRLFENIHDEFKKAFKIFDSIKMPRLSFPDFEFPEIVFPEIRFTFPASKEVKKPELEKGAEEKKKEEVTE